MAATALSSDHDVLTKYAAELSRAFSSSLKSVYDKLLAKGIISKDSHDKVTKETGSSTRGSSSSAEEKAKELVSCLVDHVQEKPETFQDLLQYLEEEARFKDVAEKIKGARTHTSSVPQHSVSQTAKLVVNLSQNFDSLVSKCLASLESRGITPQALANSILYLKLFDYDSEESLVVDCKNDIQQASSNAAIFELVKPYMSFLNPELLAHIIEYLGSDNDRKDFKDYMKELEEYCSVTQVVLPYQPDEKPESEMVFQKVTVCTGTMNLKSVQDIKTKIAKLLQVNVTAFQIYLAGGTPPAISFQLPNFTCERVFPLSNDQERELRAIGGFSLKCGDYSCGFTEILLIRPDQVSDEAEKEIEMPSLGRPFYLGMLYDCRKDNLIRCMRICTDDVMESCLEQMPQERSIVKIIPADTLGIKAQSLGLTPDLKLSLMAGLVKDISGAALYWKNHATSKHKTRVCVLFESTKCIKLLSVEKLHQIGMLQHPTDLATHVVTKIVYGIDAYFIVECDVAEGETHQVVHDEIGDILTTYGIAGDQLKMPSTEETPHDLVKRKAVCTVFSDTSPTKQSLTLYEGIQMFKQLMQQASNGSETDQIVPKNVSLCPLKMLDNRYNAVVRPISSQTVDQFQSMIESINDLDTQVNDLLSFHNNVISKFQYLGKQLEEFRDKLMKYKSATTKSVGDKLPHVREGRIEEMDIAKAIKESTASPFHLPNLHSWLKQKSDEASVLSLLTKKFEDRDFASSKELETISVESDYVVCFAFNIGSAEDPVLKSMGLYNDSRFESNYFPSHTLGETPLVAWYQNTSTMQGIHSEADNFKEFWGVNQNRKNIRFIITSDTLDNSVLCGGPGSIFLYEDGTPRRWEPPGPPGNPVATVLSHHSVTLEWSKPDRGCENVECYIISYHSTDSTSWKKWTTNNANVSEDLTELDSNVEYVFKVQAQCTNGFAVSGESVVSNLVITSMSPGNEKNHSDIVLRQVEPVKPSAMSITHNSVVLRWAKPECDSENIDGYTIFYSSPECAQKTWARIFTKDTKYCVRDLDENTKYLFKVRAELNGGDISKFSEISDTVVTKSRSLPSSTLDTPENDHSRPGKPEATSVTHESISLSWTPPLHTDTDDIQLYIVSYRPLNDPDDTWYKHSENKNVTSITVHSLSANTKYIFMVRPEFKTGSGPESEISDPIKTKSLCQPGKPKSVFVTNSSIHLEWERPEHGSENIEHYVVTINQDGKTPCGNTTGKVPKLVVDRLKPRCHYTFKVLPVVSTSDSYCKDSPWSEIIETAATSCPTKLSYLSVTHDSMKLKWNKPAVLVEEITSYVVYYQQNDKLPDSDQLWQKETSKETNRTLRGLSPATAYTFKVQPQCKSGWLGTQSKCTSIETKATSPPGIPTLNTSIPITHDSIPLQWTKPEHGYEYINQYVVKYREQNERSKVIMKFTKSRETDMVVNELKPKVKYCFSVHCECVSGIGDTGKWSKPISTKASSPPGKPLILNERVTNKKVNKLQWTQPKFGSKNVKSYTVLGRKSSTDHLRQVAKTNGTETECIVEDLEIFTEYIFHIRPECGKTVYGCPSEESDPVRTKPTSAPKSVQAKQKYTTHNSIVLGWKPPDTCVQSIKYYTILYRKECEPSAGWNSNVHQTPNAPQQSECTCTITNLCANTSYMFKVRPECDECSGTESEVSSPEKTKPVCQCGKPKRTSVTHDSITWEWTKPTYDCENVLYYMVWCKINNHEVQPWIEKEMKRFDCKIKMDRLVPNTTYILKVLPHMQSGNSTGCEDIQSDPVTTKATSPPGKPEANAVTHDTIHLVWTKPKYGSDKRLQYCVEYWCTSTESRDVIKSTTTEEHVLVKELIPGAKYVFCIKPESSIGEGANSELSNPIQTKATSPPGKPVATKVTHNSVHLEWTKPEVGTFTSYSVIYEDLNSQVEINVTVPENSTVIDHLEPKTQYTFKIQPNGVGLGTESEPSDIIETNQVCKTGKPIPSVITHNSIQLKWDKPEFIGSGRIQYYSVSYWHTGGTKNDVTTNTALEKVTLQGLSTNQTYHCEVTPKLQSDEELACEASLSDPTKTKPTSEPGKPKALRRTHDSIELQWTKPEYGSENIEYYVVSYRLTNESEQELHRCPVPKLSTSESGKPVQSFKIEALQPNSSYVFQVHPDCKRGSKGTDSCFSEPILTTCTSVPGNLKSSAVTHDNIQLQWTKPEYGSDNIKHYVVSYCTANEYKETNPKWTNKNTSADETQITLTGLNTLTKYFFKVHPECTNGDGAVYECNKPTETKATSSPGRPKCISVTHNSITIKWTIPEYGCENIENYIVSYFSQEQSDQVQKEQCATPNVKVCGLCSNTAYIFKVHPESAYGESSESPVSEPIKTQPCCQPGNIVSKSVTHSSIQIEWAKPEFGSVDSYVVKCYQEKDRRNEIDQKTIVSCNDLCAEFKDLQPKSWYMFEVTAECSANLENIGIESTWSVPIETPNRPLAERMRSKSVCIDKGPPVIYKVPVQYVMEDPNHKIAKCYIGEPPTDDQVTEKVLMVVGATGAGKTTLINGITNYIFNVQWEDDFRFKLITDENPERDQSQSQTSWITAYTFYPIEGSCIDYILTIIDTPGFGDCEGVERDKRITSQIQEFLFIPSPHDINEIHGIGFVTQSSLARLTPTQKYIFDSILAIFGRDIAENIFLMCTFADGELPPVLNAVKAANVPGGEKKHFEFNNSALFAKVKTNELNFIQMFWKMGKQSFESFFKDFQAAPRQSLQMTKQVMIDRQHLEILVERFHQQIKMGLSKIDELQQEEQVLKTHKRDIEANKNFTYEVTVTKYKAVNLDEGKYVTNCIQCKLTCHADCTIDDDDEKYKCRAMGWLWQKTKDAHCKVCPGKCHWKQHVNKDYYYVPEEVPEERTLEDLKAKYDQAVGGKTRAEQMISKNEQDLEDLRGAVLELVREMKEKQERLQEIALKPNPLTEESYIEILIQSETLEAERGFEKRIASLKMIKDQVKLLSRATTVGSGEEMKDVRGKSWWQIWQKYF